VEALGRLAEIDWAIGNPDWQGVAVQGRRVSNTAVTIRHLGALLAFRLGCTISHADAAALADIMQARGHRVPPLLSQFGEED